MGFEVTPPLPLCPLPPTRLPPPLLFLTQPLQLSVSFTPKETRSCQLLRKGGCFEGAAVPDSTAFSYFKPRKVCRLRKSWWVASFNLLPPHWVCQVVNGLSQCNVLHITENFIDFVQFCGIMWLFSYFIHWPKTKKKSEAQKKKLWITCDLLLQTETFMYLLLDNCFCNYIWILKKQTFKLLRTIKKLQSLKLGIKKFPGVLPHGA